MPRKVWITGIAVFLLTAVSAWGMLYSQRGGRDRFGFGNFFEVENPDQPRTEFIFARWQYGRGRNGGWWHDYPDAEEHITQIMKEATGIDVDRTSYAIVPMSSRDIFKYPFGYISEPGMMLLTDTEVKNFREFIDRGGFVMLDDFDGPRQWSVMKQNLDRVFPDRPMFRLDQTHPILHTYYDIDSLYVESPYNVGADAVFYGINNEKGVLSVVICFNNDVGDFWELIDRPVYAVRPSAEALKLGINFVVYAMTH
jgi:hypothetical protein